MLQHSPSNFAFACIVAVCMMAAVASGAEKTAVGQYTIVGSQHIRFNSAYHVAVSVHNATEPSTIRLSIVNGADYNQTKEVTVQPWSTETVAFDFGELPAPASGIKYKLIADGLTGAVFHNETELRVINKQFSILVQSDKALYKPGDLIRFRALVIDAETKPHDLHGSLQVYVKDGASNRVKQWSNQTTTNGVFAGEFRLSDAPVLGSWSLHFEALRETKQHHVEVAEYVLPVFEAFIETPAHVLYKARKIQANLRGKYTFGKPVHGQAVVTLKRLNSYNAAPGAKLEATKTVKVTTKGSVEFDMLDDLELNEESSQSLQLDVSLEEEFTGRQKNVSTHITVHRNRYDIVRQSYMYNYADGQPFEFDLQVNLYDGTPVQNGTLELWYSSDFGDKEQTFMEKYAIDKQGMVKVKLSLPMHKNGYFVMAKYLEHTEGFGFFPSSVYHPDAVSDFSLTSEGSNVVVGEEITVELVSRLPLHSYTYQLIARGDVLLTRTVQVENTTQQKFPIKFQSTFAMMPNVRMVAYTIREDGSVDVANSHIFLQANLSNSITLEPSVNETTPATEIDLTISTPDKSFVGLLAVDQSVLLLRSGNDFSENDVTNSLDEFGNKWSKSAFEEKHINNYGSSDRFMWSPKISSFENVGVFVLSNVEDLIPKPRIDYNILSTPAPFAAGIAMRDGFVSAHVQKFAAIETSSQIVPTIRKDFPETWIWDSMVIDSADGVQKFHTKVPDTITSWVISAFSLSPSKGLGLTSKTSKVTVFKSFFVSLNLPYSVKRGEVVAVPIVVFNYLDTVQSAEVTLHNVDNEFEFVELSNDIDGTATADKQRSQTVNIKSNDATGTSFMIRPLKVGQLTIKVTAVSPMAGDGIELILPVTPEGVPQYVNKAVLIDRRAPASSDAFETKMTVDVPADAVPDSTRVEVSAIGDVMGATIQNLGSLIRMPSGCGEQNMLGFVPNIVVRNYLKAVGQLTDALELKTRLHMEIGYQRQLTYRHTNGSFSAFGTSDFSGSTWLTAFVARSFRQAAEHIDIEERIIREALDFLRDVQSANGSFAEIGTVIHQQMQSGAGQGVALTAYTLLAFLENKHAMPEYAAVIEKAVEYVVQHLDTLDDEYALGVAAYALQLANHEAKERVLRDLDAKATIKGELKHWGKSADEQKPEAVNYWAPVVHNSVSTEITSYALLAHLQAGPVDQIVPIMKWLLAQRNEQGGFSSTQDTIVGLQALATVAAKLGRVDAEIKFALSYKDGGSELAVNPDNALVLQQVQLPGVVKEVGVKATGSGFGLLSLSYSYYVSETEATPRFLIEPTVEKGTPANALRLHVCASFIPHDGVTESNMAVMEIAFPSGYTFDTETRDNLAALAAVRKVEPKNGDTLVVLYFDKLSENPVCLFIEAVRTHKVANQKPAAITAYDYYDTTRKSRVFYNTDETRLCDICDQDCPAVCKA